MEFRVYQLCGAGMPHKPHYLGRCIGTFEIVRFTQNEFGRVTVHESKGHSCPYSRGEIVGSIDLHDALFRLLPGTKPPHRRWDYPPITITPEQVIKEATRRVK